MQFLGKVLGKKGTGDTTNLQLFGNVTFDGDDKNQAKLILGNTNISSTGLTTTEKIELTGSGALSTVEGNITSTKGSIITTSGHITATNGDLSATNGNIKNEMPAIRGSIVQFTLSTTNLTLIILQLD